MDNWKAIPALEMLISDFNGNERMEKRAIC